uniref:Reverse transcriptase domain-containing protein n=1 Tax=Tanacetum cinerariifolium TaxID=118510 RepID=A0A6L2MAM6_TANCI|nr:hypothetical protein [Tanacetum cinerariifolium]
MNQGLILDVEDAPQRSFCSNDDDDYEETTIPLNEDIYQEPSSNTIRPVLPTLDPEDSLIIGNEELSTIPKKESDEFIRSSVEDLVPIPSKSQNTSGSDSKFILPSCDDFSPINIFEEKSVTFSNPLFNSINDFTSINDESLFDKDVPEDNVKIYSNTLFEFNDEYISSDVNPLFDEVLEDIECKVSYDSNLDKPTLLFTPLFDSNKDECFAPGDDVELLLYRELSIPKMSFISIIEGGDIDEIDAFLNMDVSTDIEDGYYDSGGDVLYLESLLNDDTTPTSPPDIFVDHDPRSLNDINDLKIMVQVFDLGIYEKTFSPTYDCLGYEDSRACGFVHHPLELQSFEYGNMIS